MDMTVKAIFVFPRTSCNSFYQGKRTKLLGIASSCSLDWQHWLQLQGIASVWKNDCQHSFSLEMLPLFLSYSHGFMWFRCFPYFSQKPCTFPNCLHPVQNQLVNLILWFLVSLPGYNAIAFFFEGEAADFLLNTATKVTIPSWEFLVLLENHAVAILSKSNYPFLNCGPKNPKWKLLNQHIEIQVLLVHSYICSLFGKMQLGITLRSTF